MTPVAQQTREDLIIKQRAFISAKAQVQALEDECSHNWGNTVSCPIVTGGCHFEGDPEGTMGIDRRLPCYIPKQEKPRWKRVCLNCGKEEYIEQTVNITQVDPVFRN